MMGKKISLIVCCDLFPPYQSKETNKWPKMNSDYLNKNSEGNLFILKHYVYSVSNFRPLGLCQETNNQVYVVSYILVCDLSRYLGYGFVWLVI